MKKIFLVILGVVIIGCGYHYVKTTNQKNEGNKNMKLFSPAFENNQSIPKTFTCEGKNISPELKWEGVPSDAKSLALIVDDPDAPNKTWVHWVVYNLPAHITKLDEGMAIAQLGGKEGNTDFGKPGFGGPCPPKGHGKHRYFFKLYALDTILDLPKNISKQDLEKSMEGHILAKSELVGLYERS
ncbi:MAG: YbhB/YbcL family Raf kinase inhibitor-like protein [Candidatus Babeliales bacterium]